MNCCKHSTKCKSPATTGPHFPLAMACEREDVQIHSIRGGIKIQERLLSMGIVIGDKLEILQRQNKGAVLISKEGNRFALGGGMAQKINVTKG